MAKVLARNKKAYHLYTVLEKWEAGLSLKGTEVKSIRLGKVNFADSFASIESGELYIKHLNVSPYEKGNIFNHEATRKRKCLMHKREIQKLRSKLEEKGMTLVPLQLYLNPKGRIKLELGVCRGKKLYDKRQAIDRKAAKQTIRKAMQLK